MTERPDNVLIVVDPEFTNSTLLTSVLNKFIRDKFMIYSPARTSSIVAEYCKDRNILYSEYTSGKSSDLLESCSFAVVFFVNEASQGFLKSAAKRTEELGIVGVFIGV